jgi:hypothetical protein
MATEVWFRNPVNYIKECVEAGINSLAWDFGILKRRTIDPFLMANLYYGVMPWRAMVIGEQGALLINNDHDLDNPVATYPVWEYGGQFATLEKFCANNINPEQAHVVVVIRPPTANSNIGRAFYQVLAQLQDEYPDCTIHVHGLYSFRVMFALGLKSVDYEPRELARMGKVVLPSGKEVTFEHAVSEPQWVNLVGMKPYDLKIPRNRCIYNMRSALWAGEHFTEAIKFKTKGFTHVDPDNPLKRAPRNKSIMVKRTPSKEGDKFLCDMCSLQTVCKYFRTGAVCIVPDSEPVELARFFQTRDSDQIISGLGTLLATQTRRIEKALKVEAENDSLHPETTKMINTLFDRGVKLAKLVDPSLAAAGAPKTVNLTQINASTPNELMAQIVESFVQQGIPRGQITPDMIQRVLSNPEELQGRAIDVASQEKSA